MQYSSKFLLRIYLDFLECYLLSNDSTSQTTITICFFIISYSNIVINTQTFRYLVGYLPVKSTKELLEN